MFLTTVGLFAIVECNCKRSHTHTHTQLVYNLTPVPVNSTASVSRMGGEMQSGHYSDREIRLKSVM